jgi:hypothetical protein
VPRGPDEHGDETFADTLSTHFRMSDKPGKMASFVAVIDLPERGHCTTGVSQAIRRHLLETAVFAERLVCKRIAESGTSPYIHCVSIRKPIHQFADVGVTWLNQ